MKMVDRRLDRMIQLADEMGVSLDDVVMCLGRVDHKTFAAVSDNPSLLPRYIKSSVKP
jgi:predicted DNA repair protein MutK